MIPTSTLVKSVSKREKRKKSSKSSVEYSKLQRSIKKVGDIG